MEWISWTLQQAGYRVYLGAWNIRPGDRIDAAITSALGRSERVIAVLSPDYLESRWGATEWHAAWAADPRGVDRRLLPVRVAECTVSGPLGGYIYIDLVDLSEDDARAALLRGVKAALDHCSTKPDIAPAFPGATSRPGRDLASLMRQNPSGLDTPSLMRVVEQVTAALAELHSHNAVHRDIRPENVLMASGNAGNAVLIDVGSSEPALNSGTETVYYTAPEVLLAQSRSPAADWWALGMLSVELASGRHPYRDMADEDVRKQLVSSPVDLSAVRDQRLQLLCRGLLARDPRKRWGAAEVRRWLAGGSPPLPPDDSTNQSRRGGRRTAQVGEDAT